VLPRVIDERDAPHRQIVGIRARMTGIWEKGGATVSHGRRAAALVAITLVATWFVPPVTAAPPGPLLVADLRACAPSHACSPDEQLVFAALEGIVNRGANPAQPPRIYLTGLTNGQDFVTDLTAEQWLHDAVPLPKQPVMPYDLLTQFADQVHGLVIWDPQLPVDTQDIATTMAGLNDWLPVSPALADDLSARFGFTVAFDLRTLHLTMRAQAYDWALAHLPLERITHLAWVGDTRNGRAGHSLRDWIVARRGFAFEGEPKDDNEIVRRVLGAFPPGMQVFGYPFFDDAFYRSTGLADDEGFGVGEISQAGKELIPTTDASNLTVHSSFAPITQHPTWDDAPEVPAPDTTYVAFLITDGDNLGYNLQALRTRHWDNPTRRETKSVPVGISISPRLAQYAPLVYNFYLHGQGSRPDQVFVNGPSGAGYIYPTFHTHLPDFLAETKGLLALSGLRAVWLLDNGYLASPPAPIVQQYADALTPSLSAVFADYGGYALPNPPSVSFAGDVPVVHALWAPDVASTVPRIKAASATYPGRPAFVLVALSTWNMSFDEANAVIQQLGPGYIAVRPDRFIGLVKGARLIP
jgi:hypothetical protein